jgi:Lysylphosphatidylglycerol synthase TM region
MARIFPSISPFRKTWLVAIARVVVLIALLAFAFARVDVHELQRELIQSRSSLVLAATVLVALGVPIAAWRWQLILAGMGATLRFELAARLTLVGLFLSQFLPGVVGSDAARIWLTTQAGISAGDDHDGIIAHQADHGSLTTSRMCRGTAVSAARSASSQAGHVPSARFHLGPGPFHSQPPVAAPQHYES